MGVGWREDASLVVGREAFSVSPDSLSPLFRVTWWDYRGMWHSEGPAPGDPHGPELHQPACRPLGWGLLCAASSGPTPWLRPEAKALSPWL